MKHGDFTLLAEKYAQYRPGYSPVVLDAFIGLAKAPRKEIICADVGAGTGIWTRQLASKGLKLYAVEPNDAMRAAGKEQNGELDIAWIAGSAEATGLPDASVDMVCMASSFHWPDFDKAIAEFDRILKSGGIFMALWNTRRYEVNPLLVEIETYLHNLVPEMKRVSSGRSEFCATLTDSLANCGKFEDVLYLEGIHTEQQTPERYAGLWESVNDVRVQAGEERFAKFMDYIREKTAGLDFIDAQYLTRAWLGRKPE